MDKLKDNIGVIMVILGLIGSTGTFYSKFAKMEATIEQLSNTKEINLKPIERKTNKNKTDIAIANKEIELLKLQIKEFRAANSNPLR
mgnify:FL=1|tara:strand:+ start:4046 stop:4306 length:261 start_codon:yes stop_codon:yes gene_type:complete